MLAKIKNMFRKNAEPEQTAEPVIEIQSVDAPVVVSVTGDRHHIRVEFENFHKEYAFDMHGNLIDVGTFPKE